MSLKEQINQDIKLAMKAKDKETLAVLRMIKSAILLFEIDKKAELTPEDELTILSREAKQRRDSVVEFQKAGRDELVEKTQAEIEVVERYLPKQLSLDEIQAVVKAVAEELKIDSKASFGPLMGAVMAKLKGQADGKVIKEQVQAYLATI